MIMLPSIMPDYTITKSSKTPFKVIWEEMIEWFIVPKPFEECSWAIYDQPSGKRTESYDMKVLGKASVHGIEGIEIRVKETLLDGSRGVDRTFIAELTETHTRFLAECHYIGDTKCFFTFHDSDVFNPNWGYGENNSGNEINIKQKGTIQIVEDEIICSAIPAFDVAGRYMIDILGKSYDTILLLDVEMNNKGILTETYVDKKGRTVLWRRFNRDDWKNAHYKQKWSEKLPDNNKLIVNGNVYVHWYDCITDHIL